jgi:hypothetical protein
MLNCPIFIFGLVILAVYCDAFKIPSRIRIPIIHQLTRSKEILSDNDRQNGESEAKRDHPVRAQRKSFISSNY